MKKIPSKLEGSLPKSRKSFETGAIKHLTKHFKRRLHLTTNQRYGLPPMAPHNTTQEIIDSHPEILNDVEDLYGSLFLLIEASA